MSLRIAVALVATIGAGVVMSTAEGLGKLRPVVPDGTRAKPLFPAGRLMVGPCPVTVLAQSGGTSNEVSWFAAG